MSSIEIVSNEDKVTLTKHVHMRMNLLLKQAKRRGKVIDIPPDIHKCLLQFRTMLERYQSELYLHTRQEAESEQTVCHWLVQEWKHIVPGPGQG
jgi:hypothetical protein